MMMCLREGDYIPDGGGGFQSVSGKEELLQRILFKLTARRGGFYFLPSLGSRLYRLPQEKPSARAALAKQYVEEALADEVGLEVQEVHWEETNGALTVYLSWREETFSVSWTAERRGDST